MNGLTRHGIVVAALLGSAVSALGAQVEQPVVATADVQKSFRLTVPTSFTGASLTIECPTADDEGFAFDPVDVIRKDNWSVRLLFRTAGYVNADNVRLRCSVSDGGADVLVLDVTVRPTQGRLNLTYAGPDSVRVGETFRASVRADVDIRGGPRRPVSGLQVKLSLPGATELLATTDRAGTALFNETTLRGRPGRQTITSTAATTAFRATQQDQLIVTKAAVKKIVASIPASGNLMVSEPLRGISVSLEDEFKNPVCSDAKIALRLITSPGELYYASDYSNPAAEILIPCTGSGGSFGNAVYWGPIQPLLFEIVADGVRDTVRLTAIPGYPARINVLDDPPAYIRSDLVRPIRPATRVRLEDAYGNRVPGQKLDARVLGCGTREGKGTADCVKPQLQGATLLTTDTSGKVTFDSLVFIGTEGDKYQLCFVAIDVRIDGAPAACDGGDRLSVTPKAYMRYDVNREYNKNLLIVSAIHSVGGTQQPANELFDLRLRFRLPRKFSSLAWVDLPLQRKSFTDTVDVKSTRSDVPDIQYMLNWDGGRMTDPQTGALERLLFLGGQLRVFAGVPYAGAQSGSIEMGGSLFFGTTASIGYIWPLSKMPVRAADGTITYPADRNIVVDAFLRSSGVDFMKYLNVRGTFILPQQPGRKVRSRIVIAVPIGTITPF